MFVMVAFGLTVFELVLVGLAVFVTTVIECLKCELEILLVTPIRLTIFG